MVVNGAALVPNIDVVALIFVMERGAGFSEVEMRASLIECIGRMERKQRRDPCGLGNHEKPKQPGSTASHRPPNDHANRPNLRGPPGLDLATLTHVHHALIDIQWFCARSAFFGFVCCNINTMSAGDNPSLL